MICTWFTVHPFFHVSCEDNWFAGIIYRGFGAIIMFPVLVGKKPVIEIYFSQNAVKDRDLDESGQ